MKNKRIKNLPTSYMFTTSSCSNEYSKFSNSSFKLDPFQLISPNWKVIFNQLWHHLAKFCLGKSISLDYSIVNDISLGLDVCNQKKSFQSSFVILWRLRIGQKLIVGNMA
jgi:hypothetical protein